MGGVGRVRARCWQVLSRTGAGRLDARRMRRAGEAAGRGGPGGAAGRRATHNLPPRVLSAHSGWSLLGPHSLGCELGVGQGMAGWGRVQQAGSGSGGGGGGSGGGAPANPASPCRRASLVERQQRVAWLRRWRLDPCCSSRAQQEQQKQQACSCRGSQAQAAPPPLGGGAAPHDPPPARRCRAPGCTGGALLSRVRLVGRTGLRESAGARLKVYAAGRGISCLRRSRSVQLEQGIHRARARYGCAAPPAERRQASASLHAR